MLAIKTRNTRRIVGLVSLTGFILLIAFRAYVSTSMALALTMVWMVPFSLWMHAYWRDIGEVARDGQKTAWLWGGIGGMIAAVFLLVIPPAWPLIQSFAGLFDFPTQAIDSAFIAGMMWAFAAQIVGCTLYWAFWWIAKR